MGGGQLGDGGWLLGVQGGLMHAVVGLGSVWGQIGDACGHHGVQGGLKHAEVVAAGVWGLVILGSGYWYFEVGPGGGQGQLVAAGGHLVVHDCLVHACLGVGL